MVPDYLAAVLLDSPAAFWELQDAGDFPQDSSGNGKHMEGKSIAAGTGLLNYRPVASGIYGPLSSYCVQQQRATFTRSTDTVLTAIDNISMELWYGSYGNDNVFVQLFFVGALTGSTNASTLGNNGWGIYNGNSGGTASPGIRVLTAGTLSTSSLAHASPPTTGQWQHIVIVRRSGTWEMWINGAQDTGIGTFTAAPGPYTGAGQGVYLGTANTTGNVFRSAFAALYPVALSPTRITAHYAAMVALNNAHVELDEHPTGILGAAFTTKDAAQGLVPDRPPHDADYPELSWLGTGTADIEYASGGDASLFV